jgi:nitrogen fixation protein FixH
MKIYKSPIMLLMFALLLTLVVATIYRVVTALNTHPGLVVESAYEGAERYAKVLARKQQLSDQGWDLSIIQPKNIITKQLQKYIAVSSQHGVKLTDAQATAYFYRPLEQKFDFSMAMHINESGAYQVDVALPLKGRWELLVEITKDDFLQRTSIQLFANN